MAETTTTTTTTTSSSSVKIDSKTMFRRLKLMYDSWDNAENESLWKGADALVVSLGTPDEENPYQKVTTIQTWLFGYELRETVCVFLKKSIHVISSPKKISIFQAIEKPTDGFNISFSLHTLNKADNNQENFQKVIDEIKKSKTGKNAGIILKEKLLGDFGKAWSAALDASGLNKVDITLGLASLLSIKDSQEIKNLTTSAKIADKILKSSLLPRIENIIDKEEKVTHRQLSDFVLDIFSNPEKISPKLSKDVVDNAYTPIIQSGGVYDLRLSTLPNEDPLHFGTMVVSIGARFKSYCSNIARTYFVDPNKEQKQNYILLLGAQGILIKNLKIGAKLNQVYDAVVQYIDSQKSGMSKYFLKNCGFGIGNEFQESYTTISATNQRTIKAGMVFNLIVGFQNIENKEAKDDKSKLYSILISDTACIEEDGKVNIFTQESPKKAGDVFYTMNDNGESDDEEEKEDLLEMTEDLIAISGKTRETKNKSKTIEEKRREHQNMLAQKNLAERESKIRQSDSGPTYKSAEVDYTNYLKRKDLNLFNNMSAFPPEVVKNKIHVDPKSESLMLPIYGYIVPFHISTIKNVSKSDEYLRINFNSPNSWTQEQIEQGQIPPQLFFIREVTYRIQDPKSLSNSLRLIKELRKRVTNRETENREKQSIVEQEKLVLTRGRFPKLNDVSARPTVSGRRSLGSLEAHDNGFRFNPSGVKDKTPIDVLYKNIKHALFQQAEQESIVLVHFHLHNAVMIGKKKSKDVQFFTEISDAQSLDLSSRRGNDEYEEEYRDAEIKRKLNSDFQLFVKRVEEIVPGLEFDIPYRELAFYGVPNITNVLLQPTVQCLVSLHETPFFVLTLDEIEIACFERVSRSLNNFDLVFVYKDYSKVPIRINIIPRKYFETIKDWLDSCNIKFYMSEKNLQWKKIMDSIKQDLEGFIEDGGWSFLDPEEGGSSDEEDEESDEDYEPASDEDFESDSLSSQSSLSDDEDEESESEGEDWEELDSKAAAADKKKNYDVPASSSSSSKDKDKGGKKEKSKDSGSSKKESEKKSSSSSKDKDKGKEKRKRDSKK